MIIGIPRAFLYYRYQELWLTFFEELGIEYIISPETNKEILRQGTLASIDEACLASKVYLGHVEWLIGKCDYVFVPRLERLSTPGTVCTKFQAVYDVVANTFRDRGVKILYYNIDRQSTANEMKAFLRMGKYLGHRKPEVMRAYLIAKQAEKAKLLTDIQHQNMLLDSREMKILIVGHAYNAHDAYTGAPVIQLLKSMGAVPIVADVVDRRAAVQAAKEFSETLPWAFNRELVGALQLYKDRVDGIILMSAFPCGPDSLVNEIIIRRTKDKPVLNLLLEGQEGLAGVETRLESFIDIIQFKKEGYLSRA